MPNVIFEDFTVQVKEAISDRAVIALEEAVGEIESGVKRRSRKDTGDTRTKWSHYVDEDNLEGFVGNTSENSIWEELGTGEHALSGGRQTPWYVPVATYTGRKKPTYQGKVVIVHGKNGVDFYKTDGKKPSRALFNTFESKKKKIIKGIQNRVKGIIDNA